MSENNEQLVTATAVRDYFMRAWITEVRKLGRSWMTYDEAVTTMDAARTWCCGEMDGLQVETELTDHCLHWCVILRVPVLEGTEFYEVELPMNYLPIEDVDLESTRQFFKQLVKTVVDAKPPAPLTPVYLRELLVEMTEMQSNCEGCSRTFNVAGITYRPGAFKFEFAARIGGDEQKVGVNFIAERVVGEIANVTTI